MSMDGQLYGPAPGPRKPFGLLFGVVAVVAVMITFVAVGALVVLRRDDDDRAPTVLPIPAPYYNLIVGAAESCPMLTTARLAAQLMANSGFDPSAKADGREGIAGLTDQAWQRWVPWPNADRADPDANITALAHQMCDFAGQLRLARTPGDPWHLALAAHRTTLDDVLSSRGVPADATSYVRQVDGYAHAYRAADGSPDPTGDPLGDGHADADARADDRRFPADDHDDDQPPAGVVDSTGDRADRSDQWLPGQMHPCRLHQLGRQHADRAVPVQ
jgi:hypothetical protein